MTKARREQFAERRKRHRGTELSFAAAYACAHVERRSTIERYEAENEWTWMMTPAEAEEYTQSLGQIFGGGWRQILWAQQQGIPRALGLTTEEWVTTRLGGYIRLAASDRREAVRELHDQGLTQREIGTVVGVAASTVNHDLRPVANKTSGSQESPVQDGTEDEFVANETPAVQDAASAASASSEYQIQDPTEAPTWRNPQPGEGMGWHLEDGELLDEEHFPPGGPLTEEETSIVGADVRLMAAAPEPQRLIDNSREAKAQESLVMAFSEFSDRVSSHNPYITNDEFGAVNVLAARDAVRRLIDAATVWLRTLNEIYRIRGESRDGR